MRIALCIAILSLVGCNQQPTNASLSALADAGEHFSKVIGEPTGDPVYAPNVLIAAYEHALVVWADKPSTKFHQLWPDGRHISIDDPVLLSPHPWEDRGAMDKLFGCIQRGLEPPIGGVAKLWVADPATWDQLGCRLQSEWVSAYVQQHQKGFLIGPLPKVFGSKDKRKFVLMVSAGAWSSVDVEPLVSRIGEIPSILMRRSEQK